MIAFTVPGKPVAKGRPKFARMGAFVRTYTPEKTVNYETLVKLAAAEAMGDAEPLQGPVAIDVAIFVPIPVSESRKRAAMMETGAILPTKKPDADNVLKAIKDAINGVVWRDDSQAVDVVLRKRYSAQPRVVVTVQAIGEGMQIDVTALASSQRTLPLAMQQPDLELRTPMAEAAPF